MLLIASQRFHGNREKLSPLLFLRPLLLWLNLMKKMSIPTQKPEPDDNEIGDKMPLFDHLVELRRRLLYSILSFLIVFLICFFYSNQIFNFLTQPLADVLGDHHARRLIYTALHEKFVTDIKVAFFMAAFCSFPLVAAQIWMFVAPGLYRQEKNAFLPFLIATPLLFALGAACVYYGVMPMAWKFFLSFEQAAGQGPLAIVLEPKVNEYLALVMHLLFAFGVAFELPVLLTLLVRVGIISADDLASRRRYAIVIAFVVAAVLTPPDPLSQIALAIPIILLYEISIWCGYLIERRRPENEPEHLMFFCQKCEELVYDKVFVCKDIVQHFAKAMEEFWADPALCTCKKCGTRVMRPY